jgi:predicted Zn-dependent peptidase
MENEVKRLAQQGPTPAELARAKMGLKVAVASQLQQLNDGGGEGGRAGTLQRLNHYLADPGALPRLLAAREQVSAEDVRRIAAEYLTPERRVTLVTIPQTVAAKSKPPEVTK